MYKLTWAPVLPGLKDKHLTLQWKLYEHWWQSNNQKWTKQNYAAIDDVKACPEYEKNGEVYNTIVYWQMFCFFTLVGYHRCKARFNHRNAYHTTVPFLPFRKVKKFHSFSLGCFNLCVHTVIIIMIVGCVTHIKKRAFLCPDKRIGLYPNVIAKGILTNHILMSQEFM